MTCIAWDGRTLAADKMAACEGYGSTVTKIARVDCGLVGLSGSGPVARAMLNWVVNGMDPDKFPAEARDDSAELLLIRHDGSVMGYAMNAFPMQYEDRNVAIGCGANFARAAMHLGRGAREAVEVACALDIHCGNGIDTLELKGIDQ